MSCVGGMMRPCKSCARWSVSPRPKEDAEGAAHLEDLHRDELSAAELDSGKGGVNVGQVVRLGEVLGDRHFLLRRLLALGKGLALGGGGSSLLRGRLNSALALLAAVSDADDLASDGLAEAGDGEGAGVLAGSRRRERVSEPRCEG